MIAKKLGIGTLFLAMFLVGIAFVPTASAETLTEDASDKAVEYTTYPVPELEPITIINTSSKMPYWYLLEADGQTTKNFVRLH
ncbi:MAG: hypothetical protein QM426_08355 [Euryarchaeota archaeon]|nr:hypothetical protein [Euryarchaeota archaeon]